MASIAVERIRNVAVAAHQGAGKTTLVEHILFATGMIGRLGDVTQGNTVTDFEQEEINRQITISSSLAFCEWAGGRVNLIDTPGFVNFLEEAKAGMKAADGLVLIVSALTGVRGETEKLYKYATEYGIPKLIFMNKMDRDTADFDTALSSVEKAFGKEALPITFPMGAGEVLKGVVDVVRMKAYTYDGDKVQEGDIPSDLADEAAQWRTRLIERVAEADDALMEKYLDGQELSQQEIVGAVRKASLAGGFIPVCAGAGAKGIGITPLLEAIFLCLPSPMEMSELRPVVGMNPQDETEVTRRPLESEPFSAYVFKTLADPFAGKLSMFRVYSGTLKADTSVINTCREHKERIGQVFYLQGKKQASAQVLGPGEIGVVSKLKDTNTGDTLSDDSDQIRFERVKFAEPLIYYAIEARNKGDEDKISQGLHKILEEDISLKFKRDEEAKEMLLAGMGQLHLEITMEKLKNKFGVEVVMKAPKIPYRETIRKKATAQGRYKKQSGGRGQFGDCYIDIEPLPRGTGYEFEDAVVGGSVPRQYIPAVDKGIQEALKHGVYAGFQMVDVKVRLFDGSYHAVDSSEMAFKIAGSFAIKKAVPEASPVILEPVMKVTVTVPDEYLGSVIGDLNSRRGRVSGMDQLAGGGQQVNALVPMAEMLTYANVLQSMTSGRGVYTMEFESYDELPSHMAQKLIDERQKDKEED